MNYRTKRSLIVILLAWMLIGTALRVQAELPVDLTELSIEALMEVEVTLADRKPRKLSQTAAAVFVITGEDIRRSGVTSIPEALRMAPGIEVARIGSNKWAVSSRGFNSRYAYKLLVLIDGRIAYSPIFSGVFWDIQDTLLEDIDRIEIIRGPGASLWGSNAVNGIINIITKNAQETLGGLATAGFGSEEHGFGSLRYGDTLGEQGAFRFYAKYFNRDEAIQANGDGTSDEWRMVRTGFRADGKLSHNDTATLQGEIYFGKISEIAMVPTFSPPYSELYNEDNPNSGGNILGRWQHTFSKTSDMKIQIYYDRTNKKESVGQLNADIGDIDFQHRFALSDRQDVIWGWGYRFYHDDTHSSFESTFEPPSREDHLFSAFIQDDIILMEDWLRLTLGSKFEYNNYTGFEIQPNARLLWTPHKNFSLWSAVSRAVKTPFRLSDDAKVITEVIPPETSANPSQYPAVLTTVGHGNVVSEELIALELGGRVHPVDNLFFDLALFYNIYGNLMSITRSAPQISSQRPFIDISIDMNNGMKGETYGAEVAINWHPADWWLLQTAYTYLQMDLQAEKNVDLLLLKEWDSPAHQLSIRSSTDLPFNLEFDLWLRYVDEAQQGEVESYATSDVRLGWTPLEKLEFSIVGQNLFAPQHVEFNEPFDYNPPAQVERSVYGKITWRF